MISSSQAAEFCQHKQLMPQGIHVTRRKVLPLFPKTALVIQALYTQKARSRFYGCMYGMPGRETPFVVKLMAAGFAKWSTRLSMGPLPASRRAKRLTDGKLINN